MQNQQKIEQIKQRISVLEGRAKENSTIVRKLKRKLKNLSK